MDKEYLKTILDKFNKDPNDSTLTDTEKTLLTKVSQTEQGLSEMGKKSEELEKQLNILTQNLNELRAAMLKEKGKSDGLVMALLSLKLGEDK